MKKYTNQEIQKIISENDLLKKENYAYKKVVSSRRFRCAEKIATVYNQILPKWTARRKVVEKSVKFTIKPFAAAHNHKKNKINKKILKLANGYEKIIVMNSIPWDDKLKQRPHHLAKEFKKLGFFVVYFEPSNYLQKFRKIEEGLVTINSHVFLKGLPEKHTCYFILPSTMALPIDAARDIKAFGYKIVYEYIDEFSGDISGDLSAQLTIWNELPKLKPALCVASAKALKEDLENHLGKRQKIVLAPNAVFTEHFDYTLNKIETPPADLSPILKRKHPIIGFYGALAPWIDFDLVNDIARRHREWEIVLLGIDYQNAAKNLAKEGNIHNLGAKQYEELSRYSYYFNCAIIPFKHGNIAKATSPIKLFEYMAAGLPTVCTRDLRECRGYNYVYVSKDDKQFEADLEKAINDYSNMEARAELLRQAKNNTWSQRALDIVDNLK